MDTIGKIAGISKDNYRQVRNRAELVKATVRQIHEATNGKPSLGYLQAHFEMSKKALQRHVRLTLESLGLDPAAVPTTVQLERPKKAQAEQAEATVEESDETPDSEGWQAEEATEDNAPEAITE